MAQSSNVAAQPQNYSPLTNIIPGIQGVSPGAQASIQIPCNCRIHREVFQCAGIMYRNPTAVPTAVDAGATFSLVVTAGLITGINITGTVSTKAAGTYPLTIADALYTRADGTTVRVGQGATGTYTVNSSNVVTAAAITSGGTSSSIPPELFFTGQKHMVNGIVMRDITPADSVKIAMANGYKFLDVGEYPVFFTEPWRKIVDHDQATSWDLQGQSTYQILFGISAALTNPVLLGLYEFDYLRNARRDAKTGNQVPFLRPIKQHMFTQAVPGGVYNVTTIPIDNPIQRLWFYETGAGSITQLELYQDGNKVWEGTVPQLNQIMNQYGFNTTIYDAAYITDMQQRLGNALLCLNSLTLRVYSAASTTLNIIAEIHMQAFE
jgi:hypothetical protein